MRQCSWRDEPHLGENKKTREHKGLVADRRRGAALTTYTELAEGSLHVHCRRC